MGKLCMIVAVDQNGGIGYEGKLLYHLKGDMEFFKEKTMGHVVIVGRKTLESFPGGKPLPERKHLVLSRGRQGEEQNGMVKYFSSKEDVLAYISHSQDFCYVIGGEQIYRMFLDEAEEIFMTIVEDEKPADSFFPMEQIEAQWEYVKVIKEQIEDGITYRIMWYRRKSKSSELSE